MKKILHRLEQMQKGLNEQMPSKKQKTNVKRNERVRKMRRKRRIKFLLAFLAVCLIVFAVLSITVLFPITKIVTSDCGKYKAEEIISASGISVGDNMVINGWSKDEDRICTTLPYIKSVKFSRKLDGTFTINAKSAFEKFVIYSPDDVFVTDPDLKVLTKDVSDSKEVISVITYGKVEGEEGKTASFTDDADVALFSYVTQKLEEYKFDYKIVDISKSYNISVQVSDKFVVELGSKADFDRKLPHIAIMLKRIETGKTGIINISSWSVSNEEAHFKECDITDYFPRISKSAEN